MRSRTTFAVVLVLLVIGLASMLVLAGCGSEDTETTAPGETETTAGGTDTTAAAGTFDGEIVIGALASHDRRQCHDRRRDEMGLREGRC